MQTAVRLPRLLGGDFGEVRRLHPASLSLELQRRSCSTAQLVLPEEEARLPFLSFLEIYTLKGSAGLYRVAGTSEPVAGTRTYTLRHAIDTLRDSRWKAQDYDFSGTMPQFLSALLGQQNAVFWQLGVCADTGNYSREGINYDPLDELLDEVRQDRNDYIFTYDFTTTPWTLNFVPSSGGAVDCELRPTRNLSDGQLRRSRDGMCNILHLSVSTTVEDETTVTYHTYRDENSIAQFGPIEGTAGVDAADVPDPSAWAQKFLRDHAWPIAQASADGFELVKATGEAWDALDIGKTARLSVARDGFPAAFPIETLRYEQLFGDTPEKVRADLNRPLPRFSEALAKAREKAERAGRSAGGAGRKLKEQEKKFKKFETFYTQTDEKFSWLATESEWDELKQEGHVTAFTELTRTARYVEDSAKMELPFADWKTQWLTAHPDDSGLSDDELLEKYNEWIAANPYAIYNTEYSDATRTERIISKTGINALGENETVLSRITQEADRVESSVYAAESSIYSTISQTAESISLSVDNRPTTVVQNSHTSGAPTTINDRELKENDIWIDTADQTSWDAALDFNWDDDVEYDWNELRSDKIYVYRNGKWQLALDGTVLTEDADLQVESDRISLLARSIDTLDGYARENFAQLQVRANKIYSEVIDRTNNLGSRITQTATQIKSEVYAANSQIYSEIIQTASNILLHVENAVSDMGASLEVTAEEIRSSVYAAESSIYSTISQTAESISLSVDNRPTTVVQNSHTSGAPTTINDRELKENDIWIDTADQTSWDAALDFNWDDDVEYDWNELRSDKIYVYRNGKWQLALDGTVLTEDADLQVESDRISLLARNIDTLDGYARENFAQLQVRANKIYSEVIDRTNNLGSRITQTATQIKSEVYAANSQIYSEIIQTASNILLHVENEISDMGSSLEVTAEEIRSSVYAAESSIYSTISQTAESISLSVDNRPTTVVQNSHTSGAPTTINDRELKENDIWIDTADQDSWDAALDFNWDDDVKYDWNELRSDKIYVYRNGKWQLALDGTVLTEDADLQVESDRISLLARSIDTLDGYARENFAQLQVRANKIYSEVIDRTNNLGSRITQTATQIKSEVYAANSQIYSEIIQTASNILLHVENAVSDMGSTLEVTAAEIRSSVYAAESSIYTSIKQNADAIELKVSKGAIASTINQTAQSVLISASKIDLDGYVTMTQLSAVSGAITNLTSGSTTADILRASSMYASNLTVNGRMGAWTNPSMGSASVDGVVFTASELKLNHSHSITMTESGGVVTATIGGAQTADGSANFNIADTAFHKNAVSAAEAAAHAKYSLHTGYLRGSAVTVTPIGSTSYTLKYHSYATLYKKNGDDYESVGAHTWYYASSEGSRYYVAGTPTTYYNSGSYITYYLKDDDE